LGWYPIPQPRFGRNNLIKTMDKSPIKNAGKQVKTGMPVKKSKSKKGKITKRTRSKDGTMQQPAWKPFGM